MKKTAEGEPVAALGDESEMTQNSENFLFS
jgi:hypothetical protein